MIFATIYLLIAIVGVLLTRKNAYSRGIGEWFDKTQLFDYSIGSIVPFINVIILTFAIKEYFKIKGKK